MIYPDYKPLPRGVICDLVTPFTGERLDESGLSRLVGHQIASGIAGLLACGPAGEPWSLSHLERAAVISACVAASGGKVPVLAGTGTNCTQTTTVLTATAKSLGATAAYIVMPYYNKPSQEGIFRHYEAICNRVDLPVIVGVAPQHTGIDLAPRTLERFADLPGVAGIHDATGDISRLASVPAVLRRRFVFYAGRELTAPAFQLEGGEGTISNAANVVPGLIVSLHRALGNGDRQAALALREELDPLFLALERESGPPAVKYGLSLLRGLSDEVRLPMTPVVAETAAAIRTALAPLLCGSHGKQHGSL